MKKNARRYKKQYTEDMAGATEESASHHNLRNSYSITGALIESRHRGVSRLLEEKWGGTLYTGRYQ